MLEKQEKTMEVSDGFPSLATPTFVDLWFVLFDLGNLAELAFLRRENG